MKKLYPIILFVLSCGSSNQNSEAIKQKELELKERELNLREREIQAMETNKKSQPNKSQEANKKAKRELRYLYYANGGIVGYFDDGTVTGCPRCDFSKSNILAMFKAKPHATYTVERDGSLMLSNGTREIPNANDDRGWALIDFKWNQKVPQY